MGKMGKTHCVRFSASITTSKENHSGALLLTAVCFLLSIPATRSQGLREGLLQADNLPLSNYYDSHLADDYYKFSSQETDYSQDLMHVPVEVSGVSQRIQAIFVYPDTATQEDVRFVSPAVALRRAPLLNVTDIAVHVRPANNVTQCCEHEDLFVPLEPWVALMEVSHCSLVQILQIAAEKHTASAIIVYTNNRVQYWLRETFSEHGQVAVFVSQATGQRLAQLVDSGVRVMVSIVPVPVSSTRTARPPNRQVAPLPAAGILCLSLLVAVVVMGAVVTTYCLLFSAKGRRCVSRCQNAVCPSAWSHWMPLMDASKATELRGERVHRDVC